MQDAIMLNSGRYYSFTQPWKNTLSIEDAAHALSHINRFNGHTDVPYSVAQHSFYVSYAIEEKYALEGLLHDVAESVLGDITSPLKRLLYDYQRLEYEHEEAIFAHLGVEYPFPKEVHVADMRVFASEMRDLRGAIVDENGLIDGVKPYGSYGTVDPWPAKVAKSMFLQRYAELVAIRNDFKI